MAAPAPKRASASLSLSWGLVTIPTQLFSGTEASGIKRSEYVKRNDTYLKVGRKPYIVATDEFLAEGETVVKAVEVDEGIVELTDEEFAQVTGLQNGTATVIAFVKQQVLYSGGYILGDLRQLRPAKIKSGRQSVYDPGASQSFALLMAAMRKTGTFAVVRTVSRGKPQYAALLPTGDFYSLLFEEEVRERLPLPEVEYDAEMLEMAVGVIGGHIAKEAPQLTDETTPKVLEYVEAKAKGEVTAPSGAPKAQAQDLKAALAAQLRGGA